MQRVFLKPAKPIDCLDLLLLALLSITHIPTLSFGITPYHLEPTAKIIKQSMAHARRNHHDISLFNNSLYSRWILLTTKAFEILEAY
jgi:hypothetical protein